MLDRHRKMINARDTVTLSIGGQMFVTRRATLFRLPNSRLYMLAIRDAECDEPKEALPSISANTCCENNSQSNATSQPPAVYFFDRDPEIFRFVLDFYRTGELHLPASICGPFVRKELIFWGIEESFIQPCCMPAYMRYEEERRTKTTLFKDCFEDINSMQTLVHYCRGLKKWRYTLWLFLDYPSSSILAKLWATLLLLLMIASVMSFCLSTHAAFRMPSPKAIWVNSSSFCNEQDMMTNKKILQDCTTEPVRQLVYLDVGLNLIFTFEFLAKLIISPDKKKFLKTGIALLDIIILSSYWIYITLYYHYYYHYHPTIGNAPPSLPLWVLNKLSMTQALRILRIFKISKISRGLRVLMLTIKKSITELVLLGFLLMNGIFCFSSLIYMAEYQVPDTMPNIVESFWWAIITLTTVGYGDTCPKSGYGYVVGSLAAICGCVVTGLAIPIIGNNFNTYYKYMENQLKQDKYLMELHKDMEANGDNSANSVFSGSTKRRPGHYLPHLHGNNKAERVMASMIKSAAVGMTSDFKTRNALVLLARGNNPRAQTVNSKDSSPPITTHVVKSTEIGKVDLSNILTNQETTQSNSIFTDVHEVMIEEEDIEFADASMKDVPENPSPPLCIDEDCVSIHSNENASCHLGPYNCMIKPDISTDTMTTFASGLDVHKDDIATCITTPTHIDRHCGRGHEDDSTSPENTTKCDSTLHNMEDEKCQLISATPVKQNPTNTSILQSTSSRDCSSNLTADKESSSSLLSPFTPSNSFEMVPIKSGDYV